MREGKLKTYSLCPKRLVEIDFFFFFKYGIHQRSNVIQRLVLQPFSTQKFYVLYVIYSMIFNIDIFSISNIQY